MIPHPRIGFLGVGWIGRSRLAAIAATGRVDIVAIADPAADNRAEALALAPGAVAVDDLDALLALGLDGVVIATPSAFHAAQSVQALERGSAIFCQKPLGRNAGEARAVVDAARTADRLLAVDFSYRATAGMARIRDLLTAQALGPIHAVDLTFHNAYGPDKPWFYDPALSGGGCVMDLGVHLVDLALWALDFPAVTTVASTLFAGGRPLVDRETQVEDFAVVTLGLETGAVVRLACSWRLHAGCDAVIAADLYGRDGGAALRNVDGSFYDFVADRYDGTTRTRLAGPPDDWGGRSAADWATRLADGARYDPASERLVTIATVLDRIYA